MATQLENPLSINPSSTVHGVVFELFVCAGHPACMISAIAAQARDPAQRDHDVRRDQQLAIALLHVAVGIEAFGVLAHHDEIEIAKPAVSGQNDDLHGDPLSLRSRRNHTPGRDNSA